jgi:hypothetical protein
MNIGLEKFLCPLSRRWFLLFLCVLVVKGIPAATQTAKITGVEVQKSLIYKGDKGISLSITGDVQVLLDAKAEESVKLEIDLGPNDIYDIQLERFNLVQESAKIVEIRDDRQYEFENPLASTYRGTIKDDPGSQVRLTVARNYLSGFIQTATGKRIVLENQQFEKSNSIHVSAIQSSGGNEQARGYQNDYSLSPTTYPKQILNPNDIAINKTFLDTGMFTAEIAIIADYEAYLKANSSMDLANELLSILNYTDAYYNQLNIQYQLVELIIFADSYSGGLPQTTDAGVYLRAVDNWIAGGGVSNWHDIATFWTGRIIGYSYAWLNTIGQYGRHHLVEFWGMGDTRWLANFQAHEAGHNWGATHVAHDSRYIMSPYIYDGVINWNDTTRTAFQTHIQTAVAVLDTDQSDPSSFFIFNSPQIVIDDNLDGLADPGESLELEFEIKNVGDQSSQNSSLRLHPVGSSDDWISVHNPELNIGVIEVDSSLKIRHTLDLNVDIPVPYIAELIYTIYTGLDSIRYNYSFAIGQKAEYKVNIVAAELAGNSNGKFDPGERVALLLDLSNQGQRAGENITITLRPDEHNVDYLVDLDTSYTMSRLDIDESTYLIIPFSLSPDFPEGQALQISIQINDLEEVVAYNKSYMVGIPHGFAYWEDFEYDQPGSSTSGWRILTASSSDLLTSQDSMEVYDKVNDHWVSTPFEGGRALTYGPNWVGSFRVISPQIDLGGVRRPKLSFQELRAWDHTKAGGTPEHSVQLQYGYNSDGPWYNLQTIAVHESLIGVWHSEIIDLEEVRDEKVYFSFNSNQQHYYWRLDKFTIEDGASSDPEIPMGHRVYSYPNPFNSTATILYDLDDRSEILIELYNIRGQLVEVLDEGSKPAGTYSLKLHATGYDSGMYLCRLQTEDNYHVAKMMLMK